MVKTRAELQRAYRQRQKENEGAEYLEREKKRLRKYTMFLSLRDQEKIKEEKRESCQYVKEHRQRKRLPLKQNHVQQTEVVDAAENKVHSRAEKIKIRFPSFHHKKRSRKRISRMTSKNWREI